MVWVVIAARIVVFATSAIKKQRVMVVDVPCLYSEHGGYSHAERRAIRAHIAPVVTPNEVQEAPTSSGFRRM
jgi:hypothetical protein